jgi:hydroxymethylbilane synthase
MLRELDGSCRTAIGVFTEAEGGRIMLHGEVLKPDGSGWVEATHGGDAANAEAVGAELGQQLRALAGPSLMALVAG